MKELPAAWTQKGENVLEVRGGTRGSAKSRRIESATSAGDESEGHNPTADLEATRLEVLVGHVVAGKVQEWAEKDGRDSRPARRARGGARGYMQRDNHSPSTLCTQQVQHGGRSTEEGVAAASTAPRRPHRD